MTALVVDSAIPTCLREFPDALSETSGRTGRLVDVRLDLGSCWGQNAARHRTPQVQHIVPPLGRCVPVRPDAGAGTTAMRCSSSRRGIGEADTPHLMTSR